MTPLRDVTNALTGIFPTDGGIMRKQILAIAGLVTLGFAPTSSWAITETYDLKAGSEATSYDTPTDTTDFKYTGSFLSSFAGTASVVVNIAANTVWAANLSLNGISRAGWGGVGGTQDSTTFDVPSGTYTYALDVYEQGNQTQSPVNSAAVSITSAPGPVAGVGPLGLLIVIGGFAFASVRAGSRAANV